MRCHAGSLVCCLRTKKCRCSDRRAMNGVPGVMQLLSNGSPSGAGSPRRCAAARASMASRALRKRRERCWFICAAWWGGARVRSGPLAARGGVGAPWRAVRRRRWPCTASSPAASSGHTRRAASVTCGWGGQAPLHAAVRAAGCARARRASRRAGDGRRSARCAQRPDASAQDAALLSCLNEVVQVAKHLDHHLVLRRDARQRADAVPVAGRGRRSGQQQPHAVSAG